MTAHTIIKFVLSISKYKISQKLHIVMLKSKNQIRRDADKEFSHQVWSYMLQGVQ